MFPSSCAFIHVAAICALGFLFSCAYTHVHAPTSMKNAEAQATSLNLLRVMTPAERKAAITPAVRPKARQITQQVCLF